MEHVLGTQVGFTVGGDETQEVRGRLLVREGRIVLELDEPDGGADACRELTRSLGVSLAQRGLTCRVATVGRELLTLGAARPWWRPAAGSGERAGRRTRGLVARLPVQPLPEPGADRPPSPARPARAGRPRLQLVT